MRCLTFQENKASLPIELTIEQRDALSELVPSLAITPERGSNHSYVLTPGTEVGAVYMPDLAIEIRPKIPIDRLLFLISYAIDPKQWKQVGFAFGQADSLVEAIVPGFVAQLRRALHRGLLQGYRRQEEALMTVRGRLRFEEQLRRRYGAAIPIEVAYDEFTEDILENQLLKAAVRRFRHMQLRSDFCRRSLRHFEYVFQHVSDIAVDPRNVPMPNYTRLNEHYRPAIMLAQLILESTSVELSHGRYDSTAFLVNMSKVFESFVATALREALGLSTREFRHNAQKQAFYLDQAELVTLVPDLYWSEQGRCVFVGDAKYKRVNDAGIKNADLYQLLAYTIAAHVPYGLLIYAAGEGEPAVHDVPMVGKKLEVVVLNVDGNPDEILNSVQTIAGRVQTQRQSNRFTRALL